MGKEWEEGEDDAKGGQRRERESGREKGGRGEGRKERGGEEEAMGWEESVKR